MTNKKYPVLYDITFYLTDEDGNEVLNKDGTTKQYKIKVIVFIFIFVSGCFRYIPI